MGVFAPLTGIVGCIQAAEALKIITGAGTPLAGQLLLIDALTMDIRAIRLNKDPRCAVCARGAQP
jgi:adenylyltransferase/sulfurtransferase